MAYNEDPNSNARLYGQMSRISDEIDELESIRKDIKKWKSKHVTGGYCSSFSNWTRITFTKTAMLNALKNTIDGKKKELKELNEQLKQNIKMEV